jgi:hypothetical protein
MVETCCLFFDVGNNKLSCYFSLFFFRAVHACRAVWYRYPINLFHASRPGSTIELCAHISNSHIHDQLCGTGTSAEP